MNWLQVRNADSATGPVEMLIYDQIGKDWWDGSGVQAGEFAKELAKIDKGREITVCINSPGGNVWDGLAIYHQLQTRKDKVTCRVDGIAASIASIIAMAGRETVMPANALMMIHNPYGLAMGDAATLRKTADELDTHKAALVGIYADKTGMDRNDISALMDAETWFTGTEAKEKRFCDTTTDAKVALNSFDLSRFRRVPAGVTGGLKPPLTETPKQTKGSHMETDTANKPKAEAPPTSAQPPANVVSREEFDKVKAELESSRRDVVLGKLNLLAAERDIEPKDWIDLAMQDAKVLDSLAKFPPRGAKPVTPAITVGDTEPSEPKNEREAGVGYMKLCDNPRAQAAYWHAHRDKVRASVFSHPRVFTSPQAANSFTTLTHTVLSNQALEAFTYTLLPLRAFSTNFSDAPVNPGDKVKVLYVSGASAATAFTGTYVVQGVTAEGKEIAIDQRPYVSWGLTTEEIMTQPQVTMERFATQKGNALGLKMVQDVFSLLTEANYGNSAISSTSSGGDQLVVTAANFDLDEVSWLYAACGLDNWPQMRSLVLSVPYYAQLFRESEVVGTEGLASSNPGMLQNAEIRRLMGFDLYETNAISATATDNVTGFAAHPDGILIASRTLIPASGMSGSPNVRVLTDPQTGIAIVNREWFDPDNDQSKRVLEVNYGKLKGNADAIKLISSS